MLIRLQARCRLWMAAGFLADGPASGEFEAGGLCLWRQGVFARQLLVVADTSARACTLGLGGRASARADRRNWQPPFAGGCCRLFRFCCCWPIVATFAVPVWAASDTQAMPQG